MWLNAAFEVLLKKGVDAVKIQPLAAQLDLSRTSFYWYFSDRKALLDALISHWDSKNTGGLVAACEAYAESPAEAMLNVISAFLVQDQFDARLDFAVRSWSLQDKRVMGRVKQADKTRLSALRQMLIKQGYKRADADVRARTIYLVQIGYISMQVEETLETRMKRIPGYVTVFTGQEPTQLELARFYARHNYSPKNS